jgi:kinesin family protein 2/24
LKEDEFVGRALLTPGVQPEKAKLLYFKLWALHIDSRSLIPSSVTPEEGAPTKTMPKKAQPSRIINPGTFFLLDEYYREDEVTIVMVLAPEPTKGL